MIRLVVTDLDGTFWNRDLTVPPSHLDAVMLFHEEQYGGWSLVVAPPNVTKWNGILARARGHGIGPDEILAVGDGDNDVEMLTRAVVWSTVNWPSWPVHGRLI